MTTALALSIGIVLVICVLQDAFEVMLLPRRVQRRWRFVQLYFKGLWWVWSAFGRLRSAGARRERLLSIFGPLSMALLFALWSVVMVFAFGLIQWAAQHQQGHAPPDLGDQIYMSGVTFFTLGYGDIVPHTGPAKVVAVLEAGAGFGLIAVVIGYLPVLYQLFSRREAHVLQLDARAGSPPTAMTMLKRHAESGGLDRVDELLRAWELWGADLLESHLSYPMLAYYRSQHDDQSWLGALVAIMDVCTLVLIGVEDVHPLQARMTFAMARHVCLEMARSLGVSSSRATDCDRLSHQDFEALLQAFKEANLRWNGGAEAEQILSAIRATYEPVCVALGNYLLIPLPGWIPADNSPDHWDRGPRGIIARRLLDGLTGGAITEPVATRRSIVGRVRDQVRPERVTPRDGDAS
ncbi:potassium channel family protein [Phenylobacterium sp.]|uniref:potassium channel family protein n=1 Tax=Phenylobacterium sp. TaxID=1871053 RepID=UPI00122453C4|nr:potassium channel family protein [Phenylobacterium sp.]THD51243.1 MAG: potassium channel protein [Phenylobacterium sp.]